MYLFLRYIQMKGINIPEISIDEKRDYSMKF